MNATDEQPPATRYLDGTVIQFLPTADKPRSDEGAEPRIELQSAPNPLSPLRCARGLGDVHCSPAPCLAAPPP